MNDASKTVAIFGLGYVGCVSLAGLAFGGTRTIGIDIDDDKVKTIMSGLGTIVEPKLDELLAKGLDDGLISATSNVNEALSQADIALITVGTPHLPSGELDLSQIFSVCSAIGEFLKSSPKQFTIAIRSTIKPGTCEKIALLVEEVSGLKAHEEFFIVSNPEFLREGTAIDDYLSPPYVVVGGPQNCGSNEVASLYSALEAEIKFVDFGTAETIKYINNSWHAVKVAFGNEIGSICTALELNSNEIVDLFFADTILNISSYYLKPGFPYGGACLPKDLSGLVSLAREKGISAPLIESTSLSNEAHISRSVRLVKAAATDMSINYIGLSFKYDTDDIRNSPSITILKSLIAEGYKVKVYDKNVSDSLRLEKNNKLLTSILGNLEEFLATELDELENFSDTYVLAKREPEVTTYIPRLKNKTIVDLIGWKEPIDPSNKIVKLINS
jgi:GDP-mannose 6-dehydrogenase